MQLLKILGASPQNESLSCSVILPKKPSPNVTSLPTNATYPSPSHHCARITSMGKSLACNLASSDPLSSSQVQSSRCSLHNSTLGKLLNPHFSFLYVKSTFSFLQIVVKILHKGNQQLQHITNGSYHQFINVQIFNSDLTTYIRRGNTIQGLNQRTYRVLPGLHQLSNLLLDSTHQPHSYMSLHKAIISFAWTILLVSLGQLTPAHHSSFSLIFNFSKKPTLTPQTLVPNQHQSSQTYCTTISRYITLVIICSKIFLPTRPSPMEGYVCDSTNQHHDWDNTVFNFFIY